MERLAPEDVRVVRRQVAGEIKTLLEIRVLGRVGVLLEERKVAAMGAGLVDVEGELALLGKREEAARLRHRPVDLARGNAVIDEVEKPHVAAGGADALRHAVAVGAVDERSHVDERDGVEGDLPGTPPFRQSRPPQCRGHAIVSLS